MLTAVRGQPPLDLGMGTLLPAWDRHSMLTTQVQDTQTAHTLTLPLTQAGDLEVA